ncbi:MAG: glycosyltransferase [Spirulina sp.]
MQIQEQKTVFQVVPNLPPSIGGIGDYALNLARQLRQDCQIVTHFIVGNPQWSGSRETAEFPVTRLDKRSVCSLLNALDRNLPIFLNYEGYGYAKRGYPLWLIEGLKQWRKEATNPLVTMFHEIYPYQHGPPWTSSFWLSPWQKKLAARLLNMSDRAMTSKQSYAALLQQLSDDRDREVLVLPVFCNIGEPQDILPLKQRRRRMIVFGHYNSRTLVYRDNLPVLERACQALEIREVYDIGVPTGLQLPPVNGIAVKEIGVAPAEKIGELMLDAIAGFISFISPDYLAKSTVFASYCAHGLIPIVTGQSTTSTDGLERDRHYYLAGDNPPSLTLDRGQNIANCAREWYFHHDLPKQARAIARLLRHI